MAQSTSYSGRTPSLVELSGPVPPARILANENTTVLITSAGTGFSKATGVALTPWQGDRIEDAEGFFIYLRDLQSGSVWSVGWRPVPPAGPVLTAGSTSDGRPTAFIEPVSPAGNVRKPPIAEPDREQGYWAAWQPGKFTITRLEKGIEANLEVCVPVQETAELRRLTLVNRSARRRQVEVTSYAEVALNEAASHAAHPVFSKLFLQTEFVPPKCSLLARRRPRARGEHHPWVGLALIGTQSATRNKSKSQEGELQYETDRARFWGRCSPGGVPVALTSRSPLSGTTGNVLDPVLCLRRVVDLAAGEAVHLTFLLGTAPDRVSLLGLVERVATDQVVQEVFRDAPARAADELRRLGMTVQEAEYFQALAGAMLYGHPGLRAAPEVLARASGSLADLARYGLAATRTMTVLHADHPADRSLYATLVKAHRYWCTLGLPCDLIVVHGEESPALDSASGVKEDSIHWLRRQDLSESDVDLITTAAQLVITDTLPDLVELTREAEAVTVRIGEVRQEKPAGGKAVPGHGTSMSGKDTSPDLSEEPLIFFNGFGGFSQDGSEYVIRIDPLDDARYKLPPQPWINVIANEDFGFLVSETGASTTWQGNSREHRLTPWWNDPVRDPPAEALYLRDEHTSEFWSPLPAPVPAAAGYELRHGFGYSHCSHRSHDLQQETILFASRHDPVKFTQVRLANRSDRRRFLSLYVYYHLVLGGLPQESGRFVVTTSDGEPGTLFAWNRLAGEFAEQVAFAAVVAPGRDASLHTTADRATFLGAGGSPAHPAAVIKGNILDSRTGAGHEPCFAQQVRLELDPGESVEISFLLGETDGLNQAHRLIADLRAPGAIARALQAVRDFWRHRLSAIQIATPARALDLLANGWLLYQTLSCRLWGRSAFYQSGGAFGFRDQLQDASALVHQWPELTRDQILLHAAHQFRAGDVLHWWHPPTSRGLRTRFADDLLWLPYLTAFYIQVTGDRTILEEDIRFLTGRSLAPGEDEIYIQPRDSGESADLYEHCCRAIDRSLATGVHGLPLFGTGDWNDGMNRVGREGKGESVWLGFFLSAILEAFAPICEDQQDAARAARYRAHRRQLSGALNEDGWDGEWYRRGYYDDGAPLGSQQNDECRVDALAQAWAVLSGVAPPDRAARAMRAVQEHLISEEDGLIRLLTPPFEHTPHDPGYIKGYVPGVRENGGQYTHAALWVVRAFAELGRREWVAALLDLLNPINHTRTEAEVSVYRVEPYVVAADVYGAPPHVGRGGWTWYTGSAGWMYRIVLESLLGVRLLDGDTLLLKPCIPDDWPRFSLSYRLPDDRTHYQIQVVNPQGHAQRVIAATLDGAPVRVENGACRIPLRRDGRRHRVEVVLGGVGGEFA